MGSSTEHSAYGPTHNPWDLDRIPGGSGGGSAAAVAAFEAPFAIGTDTGGSIRQPGAVTGTVGMKPTYGGVSRYGLVALANSLDQAGPVTRTVLDAALLHEVIGGHDPRDSTSIDQPLPALVEAARQGADGDLTGVRIGIVSEMSGEGWQPGVMERFQESVDLMVGAGAEVHEVSCPSFQHALATYYLILPAEASSNLAKFDAMRYGMRVLPDAIDNPSAEDVMRATRDAGFGEEVKRRIILGTYALSSGYYDAYYGQAQKVRTLVSRVTSTRPSSGSTCSSHRPRRRRRSSSGRSSTTRWRCTSTTWRRSPPTSPACPASRCRADWPRRTGCPRVPGPGARVWPTTGATGSGAALEAMLERPVGRSDPRPGPVVGRAGRDPRSIGMTDDPGRLGRRARDLRPCPGARGPRRAQHRDEDVLRLPGRVRRRAQHPGLPDLPRPARGDAGRQRQGRGVGDPDRTGAELLDRRSGVGSPGRTTSTRTCRRTSRRRSTTSRSRSRVTSTSRSTVRRSGSRSSAPTWRRTPASPPTWAVRQVASTAPTTPSWTTTGPASRSSRSSPSRSPARGRRHRRWPAPTSARSAT